MQNNRLLLIALGILLLIGSAYYLKMAYPEKGAPTDPKEAGIRGEVDLYLQDQSAADMVSSTSSDPALYRLLLLDLSDKKGAEYDAEKKSLDGKFKEYCLVGNELNVSDRCAAFFDTYMRMKKLENNVGDERPLLETIADSRNAAYLNQDITNENVAGVEYNVEWMIFLNRMNESEKKVWSTKFMEFRTNKTTPKGYQVLFFKNAYQMVNISSPAPDFSTEDLKNTICARGTTKEPEAAKKNYTIGVCDLYNYLATIRFCEDNPPEALRKNLESVKATEYQKMDEEACKIQLMVDGFI